MHSFDSEPLWTTGSNPPHYNTDCSAALTCCLSMSSHYLAVCVTGQLPFVCRTILCRALLDLSQDAPLDIDPFKIISIQLGN